MTINILSIDVEEIFHIEYAKKNQKKYPYRTHKILPSIRKIFLLIDHGHEISFHGWSHKPLWELDVKTFEQEVKKFKKIYSHTLGYRAPSFSLNNRTKWALNAIKTAGFEYDSSIYPTITPLYGLSNAPLRPYHPSPLDLSRKDPSNLSILEFPLAVYSFFGMRIPIAGGFWLRLWNTDMTIRCIQKKNKRDIPGVIYVHSWELDPRLPILELNPYKKFITYYNIPKIKNSLELLLKKIKFTSFSEYIELYLDYD
jgi:polysaccharide deacetylase family protein (PEP-CTERM system associated)